MAKAPYGNNVLVGFSTDFDPLVDAQTHQYKVRGENPTVLP
jgi:hypothetical protein